MPIQAKSDSEPRGEATFKRTDPQPTAERPAEFQRFADLTQKLAQVPKSEVDEKRRTT